MSLADYLKQTTNTQATVAAPVKPDLSNLSGFLQPTTNSTPSSILTKADITKSQPSAFDVFKQIPAGLADASSKVVSGAITGEKAIAQSLLKTKAGEGLTSYLATKISPNPSKLESSVNKELYSEPSPTITEYGKGVLPKFAQKGPVPFVAGLGLAALDFAGAGGEKSAIKSLVEVKDEASAFKLLRNINVAEDLAKEYAPIIAKTSKESEVSKMIAHIDDIQKTTKSVSPDLKLGEMAAKTTEPVVASEKQIAKPIATLGKTQEGTLKAPQIFGDSVSYNKPSIPQVSKFYNTDRFNIPRPAKEMITSELDNASKQLEETVGKTLSHKEVLQRAQETSKVLENTVTRDMTKDSIALNVNLRNEIATAAKEGKMTPELRDMIIRDKAAGENIARQLEARKIRATPGEKSNMEIVLDSIKKKNGLNDEILKQAEGVDFNNPDEATSFFRKIISPKLEDWVDALRYNSMLSSPNTHIVNASSNLAGSAIVAPIEKGVLGMVDATKAALTGSAREHFVGESGAYIKGYFSDLKNASQKFVKVLSGKQLADIPDFENIPLASSKGGKVVENVLKAPGKLLEAMDQFFTVLTKSGEKQALEYSLSKGAKLPAGQTVESISTFQTAKRLFRAELGAAEEGHILGSLDAVAGSIGQLRYHQNPVIRTIAKFTFPFMRVGTNLVKQMVEYSPLGITTLWGATNKTEQVAKFIMGLGSTTAAAMLLGSDRLTGAAPTNPSLKKAWDDAGRQAWSIKLGNKWYSYSRIHPALAFNLALVTTVKQAVDDGKLSDDMAGTIMTTFAKTANFLADQSYFRNIGDFVAATKGDETGFAKYLSNYPQQLIPFRALQSWIVRITDPIQRKADSTGSLLEKQMQYMMMQIPGLSQKTPAKLNVYGQPLKRLDPLLNAFSPVNISPVNQKAEKALQKQEDLGKISSQVRKEQANVSAEADQLFSKLSPLTPQERKEYLKKNPPSPEVAKELPNVIKDNLKQLDTFERAFRAAPVEAKGKYLYEQMNSMDNNQKKEFFGQLQAKKLLSVETLKQLAEEIKKNKK